MTGHEGDAVAIELDIESPGKKLRVSADVTPQIRVRPSSQLLEAVEQLCGAGSVTLR